MTEEEINSKMTPAGGFTRSQLAEWGVPWPPPRDWKKRLIEGTGKTRERHLDTQQQHRIHQTKDIFEGSCSLCQQDAKKWVQTYWGDDE